LKGLGGIKPKIQLMTISIGQELIDLAEYDNDKTIVIKGCRGLDLTLQNQVVLLGDGTLDFDDLEGWYEAA
jgi:hypothetical protein